MRMVATAWALAVTGSLVTVSGADKVSFSKDIQPILHDSCWNCHFVQLYEGGTNGNQFMNTWDAHNTSRRITNCTPTPATFRSPACSPI